MKKLIANIAALLVICVLGTITPSCTHNNGNIGELFGRWYLESIEIDGAKSEVYNRNIFFAFQNSVTNMTQVDEYNATTIIYGDWSMDGDILYLSYEDKVYRPLPATGLAAAVNACEVIQLTNDTLIFEYTNSSNQLYRYVLTKR